MQHKFNLEVDAVKTAWVDLSATLLCAGDPALLEKIVVEDAACGEADVKRQLWKTLVDVRLSSDSTVLEDLVPLLLLPLG